MQQERSSGCGIGEAVIAVAPALQVVLLLCFEVCRCVLHSTVCVSRMVQALLEEQDAKQSCLLAASLSQHIITKGTRCQMPGRSAQLGGPRLQGKCFGACPSCMHARMNARAAFNINCSSYVPSEVWLDALAQQ